MLKHVSDDPGLCWCEACTRSLLAANHRYMQRWLYGRQSSPLMRTARDAAERVQTWSPARQGYARRVSGADGQSANETEG